MHGKVKATLLEHDHTSVIIIKGSPFEQNSGFPNSRGFQIYIGEFKGVRLLLFIALHLRMNGHLLELMTSDNVAACS